MTMAERGKALVLGGDDRAFLAVVRSLGRRGIEVHGGWCPDALSAFRSRYLRHVHELPPCAPDGAWLGTLTDLMDRERFDLVVPCDDPSVLSMQVHRRRIEPHGRCYLVPEEAFDVAFDKAKTHELARSLDIAVPAQVALEPGEDPTEALADLHFPVVVKAPVSCTPEDPYSRRRARVARTPDEVRETVRTRPGQGLVLVQEHFPGRGMGVEVLAHEGRLLAAFQHERVHEPIRGGGSTYRRSVTLSPSLMEAVGQLLSALEYTGVLMAEFRVQPRTGWWVLLELNARFWGSLPLAVAAGVDFPLYLYQMLVEGRRRFPQAYRTGLYCRNVKKDLAWLVDNLRADRADPTLNTVPLRRLPGELWHLLTGRERLDTLAADDVMPLAAELAHILRWGAGRAAELAGGLFTSVPTMHEAEEQAAARAMRRGRVILFVCRGNICRSPFAERFARKLLGEERELTSAGDYPLAGRLSPPEAVAAAREFGVDLSEHRSRRLTAGTVRRADVVFTFDERNRRAVLSLCPDAREKVHRLGVLADGGAPEIRDPLGGSVAEFQRAYSRIAAAIEAGLSRGSE